MLGNKIVSSEGGYRHIATCKKTLEKVIQNSLKFFVCMVNMRFEFWQQCCWRLWSPGRWRGVRWDCLIVFEDSIAFFSMQSIFMNWLTLVWNSELPLGQHKSFSSSPFHSFDLAKFPPPFLSSLQIHSSHLLLHPPEIGSVTLNTEAVHFSDMSEQTFTRLCETKKWPPCILWSCKR